MTTGTDYKHLMDEASLTLYPVPPGAEGAARLMIRRLANQHACQGPRCRREGHQRDVEAALECWQALGLAPDPLAPQDTYPGYGPRRSKPRGIAKHPPGRAHRKGARAGGFTSVQQ